MPNIKSREKLAQSLWDWDFLNDCWSGAIRPTDIDGVVERNGYFLFLEGKPITGSLPKGQEILFRILTREFKKATVLILFGEPGYPKAYQRIHGGLIHEKKNCDRDSIVSICKAWFNAVDNVGLEFELGSYSHE